MNNRKPFASATSSSLMIASILVLIGIIAIVPRLYESGTVPIAQGEEAQQRLSSSRSPVLQASPSDMTTQAATQTPAVISEARLQSGEVIKLAWDTRWGYVYAITSTDSLNTLDPTSAAIIDQRTDVSPWRTSFSPLGDRYVILEYTSALDGPASPMSLTVYGESSSEPVIELITPPIPSGRDISQMAWSPDGIQIIVGTQEPADTGQQALIIFDTQTGVLSDQALEGDDSRNANQRVIAAQWASDRIYLLASTSNGLLISPQPATQAGQFALPGSFQFAGAWSVKGSWIAVVAVDQETNHSVLLWNAETGESHVIPIPDTDDVVQPNILSWHPTSAWLAVGGTKHITIFDVTGETLWSLQPPYEASTTAIMWSPDGRYLVSGSSTSDIVIWDFSPSPTGPTGEPTAEQTGEISPEARVSTLTAEVIGSPTMLRGGPGVNYPVIAEVQQGTLLIVTGYLPGSNWIAISWEDSTAWVYASLLNIQGDLDSVQAVTVPLDASP